MREKKEIVGLDEGGVRKIRFEICVLVFKMFLLLFRCERRGREILNENTNKKRIKLII